MSTALYTTRRQTRTAYLLAGTFVLVGQRRLDVWLHALDAKEEGDGRDADKKREHGVHRAVACRLVAGLGQNGAVHDDAQGNRDDAERRGDVG